MWNYPFNHMQNSKCLESSKINFYISCSILIYCHITVTERFSFGGKRISWSRVSLIDGYVNQWKVSFWYHMHHSTHTHKHTHDHRVLFLQHLIWAPTSVPNNVTCSWQTHTHKHTLVAREVQTTSVGTWVLINQVEGGCCWKQKSPHFLLSCR